MLHTADSNFSRAWNLLIGSALIRFDCSNQMSDCEQLAQIPQDKWATVSESLRSLMLKEQLWANCSGHSWQISDHEKFAQVAHDKWANERFAQKVRLKLYYLVRFLYVKKNPSDSLIPSFSMSDLSASLRSLTKNEGCEQIALVTHQKWVTMIDILRSLTKNERPWANCSGHSPKMSKWANCSFFCLSKSLILSFFF